MQKAAIAGEKCAKAADCATRHQALSREMRVGARFLHKPIQILRRQNPASRGAPRSRAAVGRRGRECSAISSQGEMFCRAVRAGARKWRVDRRLTGGMLREQRGVEAPAINRPRPERPERGFEGRCSARSPACNMPTRKLPWDRRVGQAAGWRRPLIGEAVVRTERPSRPLRGSSRTTAVFAAR
jgi:hypothetical protein